MTIPDPAWRARAACLGRDTNDWFPAQGDYATLVRALAICAACPVKVECRRDADAFRERAGIRGGVSMDRASRSRPRPTAKHGTRSGYQAGCRCPDCRTANNAYHRRTRTG